MARWIPPAVFHPQRAYSRASMLRWAPGYRGTGLRPAARPPQTAYQVPLEAIPLVTQGQSLVASSGVARVSLGPAGVGTVWYPSTAAFSTGAGPGDGSFVGIYLNVVSAATIINGQLYNGGGDSAGLALPSLTTGQIIVAEWAGATPGDTASLILTGSMDVLTTA